jgi:cytochrome c oxidase assembly factor CtaG
MIAGVVISFAAAPIYTYYESIPRIWGFSLMQDQQLAGAIMWIPGSMMFLMAALVVLAIELNKTDNQSPPPVPDPEEGEASPATGLG